MSPSVTATYSYDAQGQRTESVVSVGTQVTTSTFAYAGLALLGLSASQSGGTQNDAWKITYLDDGAGRPYAGIYREPASSTTPVVFGLVLTDRGDVVALLDAAGTPFAAYRYDAWGNPQGSGNVTTGIWAQSTTLINAALATDIALRQPLRYAGYYYDSESGLHYLSARTYDPQTGQFLAKDPLKTSEETSYQYCGGNPVAGVDPSGTYAVETDDHQESGLGWQLARARTEAAERRLRHEAESIYNLLIINVAQGDETAAAVFMRWSGVQERDITPIRVQFVIETARLFAGASEHTVNEPDDPYETYSVTEDGRGYVASIVNDGPGKDVGGFWTKWHTWSEHWTETECTSLGAEFIMGTVGAVCSAAGGVIAGSWGAGAVAVLSTVVWGEVIGCDYHSQMAPSALPDSTDIH